MAEKAEARAVTEKARKLGLSSDGLMCGFGEFKSEGTGRVNGWVTQSEDYAVKISQSKDTVKDTREDNEEDVADSTGPVTVVMNVVIKVNDTVIHPTWHDCLHSIFHLRKKHGKLYCLSLFFCYFFLLKHKATLCILGKIIRVQIRRAVELIKLEISSGRGDAGLEILVADLERSVTKAAASSAVASRSIALDSFEDYVTNYNAEYLLNTPPPPAVEVPKPKKKAKVELVQEKKKAKFTSKVQKESIEKSKGDKKDTILKQAKGKGPGRPKKRSREEEAQHINDTVTSSSSSSSKKNTRTIIPKKKKVLSPKPSFQTSPDEDDDDDDDDFVE